MQATVEIAPGDTFLLGPKYGRQLCHVTSVDARNVAYSFTYWTGWPVRNGTSGIRSDPAATVLHHQHRADMRPPRQAISRLSARLEASR